MNKYQREYFERNVGLQTLFNAIKEKGSCECMSLLPYIDNEAAWSDEILQNHLYSRLSLLNEFDLVKFDENMVSVK